VIVLLQDRDGQPLRGLKVTATLLRPATEQGRSVLTLTETAPGQYSGPRAGLSGVWDARIDATGGGHSFMAERRLTWP
jgi:nitrogen fixation protein FixH